MLFKNRPENSDAKARFLFRCILLLSFKLYAVKIFSPRKGQTYKMFYSKKLGCCRFFAISLQINNEETKLDVAITYLYTSRLQKGKGAENPPLPLPTPPPLRVIGNH